jgi:hypothetical protein
MPRLFKPTPEERYMYEEEADITEIYFIVKGEWAIAFNSYNRFTDKELAQHLSEDEQLSPHDMLSQGFLIAQKHTSPRCIG